MTVKVFIENIAGSDQKHLHDERSLKSRKVVRVSRPYPHPYGFVLDTRSGDGDNLDCFVLTQKPLTTGAIVEVVPIGVLEQYDEGQADHNVLAVLPGERLLIDDATEHRLRDFLAHVFDHLPEKRISVGRLLGKAEAEALIQQSRRIPESK